MPHTTTIPADRFPVARYAAKLTEKRRAVFAVQALRTGPDRMTSHLRADGAPKGPLDFANKSEGG